MYKNIGKFTVLGLHAFTVNSSGSIPGHGTRLLKAVQSKQATLNYYVIYLKRI